MGDKIWEGYIVMWWENKCSSYLHRQLSERAAATPSTLVLPESVNAETLTCCCGNFTSSALSLCALWNLLQEHHYWLLAMMWSFHHVQYSSSVLNNVIQQQHNSDHCWSVFWHFFVCLIKQNHNFSFAGYLVSADKNKEWSALFLCFSGWYKM